jgi:anti-sigma factor RsiW
MHPDDILLNEFVDRTLGPDGHAEIEGHLEGCDRCRELVTYLRELKTAAAALGAAEPPPPPHVWRRIQDAVESDRRVPGTPWWSWLATTAALAMVVAAGVRFMSHRDVQPAPAAAGGGRVTAETVESELRQAEAHYENAIKGLEQIANTEQGSLDPATAATLQQNLAVIDQAITESRAAVRAQPNNEPAQASLFEGFKAKIAFLQDTVALINEVRKGNGAGGIPSRPRKG